MNPDKPHHAYEPIAEEYANQQDDPVMRERCRNMFLNSLLGKRVLEVGCGPGHDGAALQDEGCEVTAIDLCEAFLKYGKKTYPNVDFQCMNLEEPTFAPNTFDGIIGMACLCHVASANISNALRRYFDILRPGGCIFLSQGDSKIVDSYVVSDWGGIDGNIIEIICHHRDKMKAELEGAGFEEVYITAIPCPIYDEMPRLKKIGVHMYAISGRKPTTSD
jgi:SAM-dependent methyltransferase